MARTVEEDFRRIEIKQDQFNGLIGNFAGNLIKDRIGGRAGDLVGGILGGGGGGRNGGNAGNGGIGNLIGDLIGGGGDSSRGRANNDRGGHGSGAGGSSGFNLNNIAGVINDITGGKRRERDSDGRDRTGGGIDGVLSGLGGLIGGKENRGKYAGGGPNTDSRFLSGGVCDIIGNLIGEAAHRFLGVNPQTGKIIGAIAGNVLFNLGGKDNKLGDVGKVVLDNIVTGKWHRDVDPYVKPEPVPTPGPPVRKGNAVDFYTARDACIKQRRLFEDPDFPANDRSLYFSRRPPKRVVWLRPGEIVREPRLIYEGHSRFDVIQGELGDCWLMAAAANLTLRDELFYRVVPPDQSFTDNYAGIFHFQFWQYGRWVDVVIDDRLPTANGELLYMHSRENNEFWSALLEKAYAKLYGSYEALKGGTTSEALEDMTGGLTEFFDLQQPPENLLQLMMRAMEMGSLFGCSIEADPYVWEARLSNGLVKGHAYSITGMRTVNGARGRTVLLRIRNPWGNDQEWKGAWSDHSREWQSLSSDVKREMGLTFAHDGEFWMSFEDFVRNFEKMEICNLGPDVMDEVNQMTGLLASQYTWSTNSHDGCWRARANAGGCRNFLRSFASNPQYRIHLTDSDPNDQDDMCTVIIAVMQKYRRELKHTGVDNLAIGFAVYEASGVPGRLGTEFFSRNQSCARSAAFINLREVSGRFRVPPGEYVVIPSTYAPEEEGEFMLRVFTNGYIESESFWNFPYSKPQTAPVMLPRQQRNAYSRERREEPRQRNHFGLFQPHSNAGYQPVDSRYQLGAGGYQQDAGRGYHSQHSAYEYTQRAVNTAVPSHQMGVQPNQGIPPSQASYQPSPGAYHPNVGPPQPRTDKANIGWNL